MAVAVVEDVWQVCQGWQVWEAGEAEEVRQVNNAWASYHLTPNTQW
ncbi:MAG: hypothetical protein F6J92_08230 [Symploca sp. SIO1A3]|nr:hypothetical protein [Symploca sp. SIO1A3]